MKRISPGTVTVVVLAIVCGLVAAYVVRLSLTPAEEVVVVEPAEPTYSFVIARRNVPINTVVQTEDLQLIRVPISKKPEDDAMRRAELAVGRVAKETIKAGWIMKEKYLLDIGQGLPGVAERLPAGQRALAIEVAHVTSNGEIEQGSFVDIALSVEGDHPDLGELATRTLVRSVKVMDVARPDRRRGAQQGSLAMTVAVSPLDANRLITAEKTGVLTVTLCSVQDGEKPLVEGDADSITRKELLGLRDIPPPPAPPAPPVPPQPFRVEQWRGIQRDVLELAPSDEGREEVRSVTTFEPRTPVELQTPVFNQSALVVQPRVVGPPAE